MRAANASSSGAVGTRAAPAAAAEDLRPSATPHGLDPVLVGATVLLLLCGLVLSLGTTGELATGNGKDLYYYTMRQCMHAGAALAIMYSVGQTSERFIRRGGVLLFVVALASLALLPMFGTDFGKGSYRWYSLGFMSLQPSEFIKTSLAVTIAWFFAGAAQRDGPPGAAIAAGIAILVAGILVMQPDFGQAFLVLGIWSVTYFLAGAPLLVVVGIVAGGASVAVLAFNFSSHAGERIAQFLSGTTEKFTQGQFVDRAISGAGWFGNGVNDGRVASHLPEAHSDYIIAAAADEFGLLACGVIFALYGLIGMRVAWRLREVRSLFSRLACAAITVQLIMQAMLHYGVNLRVLPAKGVALPFVSYGGSSMLAAGLAVGVLLALTRRHSREEVAGSVGQDATRGAQ